MHLVESEEDVDRLEVNPQTRLAYVTQTTLSVDDTARVIDALRRRFPDIIGPRKDDICYATQNRQDAVKQLALECDLILVVGSANSSNTNRLRELAERIGVKAHLIDTAAELRPEWLDGVTSVGVTSGASAPESLVQGVLARLRSLGCREVAGVVTKTEDIEFSLPSELRR